MKNLFYILFLAIIVSCSNKEAIKHDQEKENSSSVKVVTFTKEQYDIANIKTEKLSAKKISQTIECTGTIEVPPANIAIVSPIIEGFIGSLNYSPGEFVNKGDILATLHHPGFIQMQQQYMEAKSQAEYFEQEYKRQGELTVENAASIKKMQKAKAEYLSSEANYKSLKAQLELLGVDPLKIEKNDFEKSFTIISPIKGTISKMNANTGKFVSPENIVYEIINDDYLFLQLNVFEKDIPNVKIDQNINFYLLNDTTKYSAKVKRIGISIDKINRTAMVQSLTEKKNSNFKPGKFIHASININEKTVLAIPSKSIIAFEDEYYVFIQKGLEFTLTKVKKGVEQGGFTEILNPDDGLKNSDIVTDGTYYLISKLEAE